MKSPLAMRWLRIWLLAVPALSWAQKAPPKDNAPTPASAAESMRVESNLGEMDAAQVERVFRQSQADLRRCYDDAAKTQHYLGGRMQLKVQVPPSGQPRAVSVVESTLGSLDVERCVVGLIEKMRFPPPKGGEGELTYPFECASRTPVGNWPSARIAEAIEKKRSALRACTKSKSTKAKSAGAAAFAATLYIGPGGKATSVGFSADAPLDEKLTRCVAKHLLSVQYDDPLGQMVKVRYDFKGL